MIYIIIGSCNSLRKSTIEPLPNYESNCQDLFRDTITPDGSYLKFIYDEEYYGIYVGNKLVSRQLNVNLDCETPTGIIPYIKLENSFYIVLVRSCGSYCGLYQIIPLDTSLPIIQVQNAMGINLEIQRYAQINSIDSKFFLQIFDFNSSLIKSIELQLPCENTYLDCISSIDILPTTVIISWKQSLNLNSTIINFDL